MTARNAGRLLARLQNDVLERIAYGDTAAFITDMICRCAEDIAPGALCSVLTVDGDGRMHPLAGPTIPDAYSRALDGLPIGPAVGSCGTAAFRGEEVEVRDIEHDPLWADFRGLALPLGLKACWSSPIKDRTGAVIGTFALYFRETRAPSRLERRIVAQSTKLCAIAIENEATRKRIQDLAFVDALSGLPNWASFNMRLRQLTSGGSLPLALLLLDVDHLKTVNDTLGHAVGDALIQIIASRLGALEKAEAFRLGGDEFAVILGETCVEEAGMVASARSLIAVVTQPFAYAGQTIYPSVTAGGVRRGDDGWDSETLCQNADLALDEGKKSSRGRFVPFRAGMRVAMIERIRIIGDVSEALADNRMLAHYQPIVRLDTGEIVGLEALARMVARDGTIVAAGSFQQALGDPKVASTLTETLLAQVASELRQWLDMGIPFQHVGFNVTTADFQKGDLALRIADAFSRRRVPLKHIILEVNESVFMGEDNLVTREVESLRAKGLRVALDDFGTGFASLTHLLKFPVDVIKIDKSFVDRIVEDRQSAVIVQALLDIARKLDMRIVAEGIETKQQAERLASLGCKLGQGFHFARPASYTAATDLLRRFGQRLDEALPRDELPYRLRA